MELSIPMLRHYVKRTWRHLLSAEAQSQVINSVLNNPIWYPVQQAQYLKKIVLLLSTILTFVVFYIHILMTIYESHYQNQLAILDFRLIIVCNDL